MAEAKFEDMVGEPEFDVGEVRFMETRFRLIDVAGDQNQRFRGFKFRDDEDDLEFLVLWDNRAGCFRSVWPSLPLAVVNEVLRVALHGETAYPVKKS